MAATRGDRRRRRDVGNQDGSKSVCSSAVSELTVVISTPALHRAVGERGARVAAMSRGDRRRRRDVGNQNGGMSLNRRPVAELTVGIITPAIHLAADLDAHATEQVTHRARFENPSIARSPAARPRRARRPSLTARVSRAARVAIGSSRTDGRARESGDGARATRRDGENSTLDAGRRVRVRVDAPSTRLV